LSSLVFRPARVLKASSEFRQEASLRRFRLSQPATATQNFRKLTDLTLHPVAYNNGRRPQTNKKEQRANDSEVDHIVFFYQTQEKSFTAKKSDAGHTNQLTILQSNSTQSFNADNKVEIIHSKK